MANIDLKKEQQLSLKRPCFKYSLPAKFFFASMEMVAGRKNTLAKTLLIELLASIPYRAWELRMYSKLTFGYQNRKTVEKALQIMDWSREAQDNEYWHVVAIQEKIKEDGAKKPWYLLQPVPFFAITFYILFTRSLALFNLRRAFLFNAEFEDHAEHVYAKFVEENPQWEEQKVEAKLVLDRMHFDNWADVFRRIGLDEREHRNASFVEAGLPEHVCPNAHDA
ncbi:MAG: hypothetical protein OES84_02360 [Kiritimatiellaceae bacterium]|nr:hypothetical protein [Kiritimatiellaceae bacterium]